MRQGRRKYTDDHKAAAVERLYEPRATQASVTKELGITETQLKTWTLEIEASGSAEANRRQKADTAGAGAPSQGKRRLCADHHIIHPMLHLSANYLL